MKKRNIVVAASLGFAQLALFNAKVLAQTQDTTSLNEVVVTASRSPKKIADIGKIVKVISREEIARAQGRTLPELLNTVAGLTLAGSGSNPGGVQSLYLRGASAANTLILIDGIAVNDASGISGEYNIAAIDISMIDHIEILKGASSTLYGSDAVAGVINIITKKGGGEPSANLILTAGSYGSFKEAAGFNALIDHTQINLNLSNSDSKSISSAQPHDTGSGFDRDGFKQLALGLNLAQYMNDDFTLMGGLQLNQNKADLDNGAFADARNYTYNKLALLAHFGAKLRLSKGELNLIFSQNNVQNEFDKQPSVTNNKGNISDLEGIFSYQFNEVLGLTSGANYKYSSTHQVYQDPNYPSDLKTDNHISSIYTSFFIHGGNVFRMEAGGRYNNHSQYGDNFTYTFNPSLLIVQQLKYYINISSAYRVPSLYQLNSQYGNADLKPESSDNYETGLQGDFFSNKLSLTASVFKRKIKNVIDYGPNGYSNLSKQNDEGAELELGFKPDEKMNINLFYTYVDGKVKGRDDGPENFNLFRRPKNSLGAHLGYAVSSKFYGSLSYKWNDDRTDQYYDEDFNLVSIQLKPYSTLDAYLQYKALKNLSVFADVKNIFDADYNDFAGYTTKGINFNAGLSFNFR